MEEAIKKVIEEGYEFEIHRHNPNFKNYLVETQAELLVNAEKDFLLDPLFWKALGKVEGWNDADRKRKDDAYETLGASLTFPDTWKVKWHSFIDHLARGGDIDTFFDNLLTPSKK